MDKPFLVRECMRENPAKVSGDATALDAIKLIMDNKISGLTVVDDSNTVIGVISELDCLRVIICSAYNEGLPGSTRVAEFMSRDVDTCGPNDAVVDVAQSMLAKGQRRRPVVQGGKLIGQVSCRNILWAISNYSNRN